MLFVILLWRFIRMRVIQTSNLDLISRRYQLMVVDMLKNWSCRYSSHYFIKFITFMLFIMLLTWILLHYIWFLVICILDLSIYSKFESIILFFLKKRKKNTFANFFIFLKQFFKSVFILFIYFYIFFTTKHFLVIM